MVENVYYFCAGEYSAYEYEFNEFASLSPDINGEVNISIIFGYIYSTFKYLKEEKVLSFFINQDTENKGKLDFKQYFDALNELEEFADNFLLEQDIASVSNNSSDCESSILSED